MRRGLLLRDFLERALYDRSSGYFSKEVIQSGQALAYKTFASEKDYRLAVAQQYAAAGRAWMTPVETFQPHYAEALARSMLQTHSARYPGEPLQVLEVGGGNGTCAAGVLNYLRREAPATYASSKYMLVEVSERLAEAQRQRLLDEGLPSERWQVVHACAVVNAGGPLARSGARIRRDRLRIRKDHERLGHARRPARRRRRVDAICAQLPILYISLPTRHPRSLADVNAPQSAAASAAATRARRRRQRCPSAPPTRAGPARAARKYGLASAGWRCGGAVCGLARAPP